MAFISKDDLTVLPWMSIDEWKLVYKQVYSENVEDQKKSCETLLIWKTRNPKLPAGVDCTLELLEVCLRDRDWSEKTEFSHYENDLRRMYSTAIMRFLNKICHLGKTKDISLYKICEKLNIPTWVVDLRHDAAHSQELPSLIPLRNAANLLFAWLHAEYWTAEMKQLDENMNKSKEIKEDKALEHIVNIIELWIAIGLYINAGYKFVKEVPNEMLRQSLLELKPGADVRVNSDNEKQMSKKKFRLKDAQKVLLHNLSKVRHKKLDSGLTFSDVICNTLFENEAFFPNSDMMKIFTHEEFSHLNELPKNYFEVWKNFIIYLHEKRVLQVFFLNLLKIVDNENTDKSKRTIAFLWINTLIRATIKQKCTQRIAFVLEQLMLARKKKFNKQSYNSKIEAKLSKYNPELTDVLSLNFEHKSLDCLNDEDFLKRMILETNDFGIHYVPNVLNLMQNLTNEQKEQVMQVVDIFTKNLDEEICADKIYTVDNFNLNDKEENLIDEVDRVDNTVRNLHWKLVEDNESWKSSPFGILPWQKSSDCQINSAVPAEMIIFDDNNMLPPGTLDSSQKSSESKVDWTQVMVTNKSRRRKPSPFDEKCKNKRRKS